MNQHKREVLALRDRARLQQRAAELSQLFGAAGWRPSTENFRPREFITRYGGPEDGWWTVAGFDPANRMRSKSCRTEEEVLAFLNEPVEVRAPESPEPEPVAGVTPPEPVIIERETIVSDPADAERIRELEDRLKDREDRLNSTVDELGRVREALSAATATSPPPSVMEYGAPDEVVTEVEPEPSSSGRPRMIASEWLRSQMKEGESLAQARNRLLQEYNDLLNKNSETMFASDDDRIRFRDLTANMTDFSKG